MKELLDKTAARAARYTAAIRDRRVAPLPEDVARLEELGGPLPQGPCDPEDLWISGERSSCEFRQLIIIARRQIAPDLPDLLPANNAAAHEEEKHFRR